jgi:exportin-1
MNSFQCCFLFVQRIAADKIISNFREHPNAWTRVDTILENSSNPQSKYIALQILENLIKYRWKSLPTEQREGIRTYLVQKIIALSQHEQTLRSESVLINKLNLLLVGILKHEWPQNWPSFIPDLVGSSRTSEVLCENSMNILKLLSEEIFEFSKDTITSAKADSLRNSLSNEFKLIFDLFEFALSASMKQSLINSTLQTLQRYVTWIPDKYIFETRLLEHLCIRYLNLPAFRVNTLMVLSEVAGLDKPQYNAVFQQLYLGALGQIVRIIPSDINIATHFQSGSPDDQLFIRHLAIFLTSFFREHIELMELDSYRPALESGIRYLIKISDIDDSEIFKICLEFWLKFSCDLYMQECAIRGQTPSVFLQQDEGLSIDRSMISPLAISTVAASGVTRKLIYQELLSQIREVFINHMAKPEEVIIEEDDSGEIVRETTKDTDALATYKVMKETLVFLTHLDPADTQNIMLDKLRKQVDGSEWGWDALNTLCWAVGTISGTMNENDEKHFLVTVIKDLLGLCEAKKGKNNKAVVASNIMYVVGQYPSFLRAHWKFLKTVVLKLFEFMHEKHPGVQDMAVDTFLKIARKCNRKFVIVQASETISFIEELIANLPSIITDLESHQIHTFYEAAGSMIAAHPDAQTQEMLTERLMTLPNNIWALKIKGATENVESLHSLDVLKDMQRVLRTNVATCRATGHSFVRQLSRLYLDMINVYTILSGFIKNAISTNGDGVAQTTTIKAMRSVKKEILNLISTFFSKANDPKLIAAHFLHPMLEPVLNDYRTSPASVRDPEVLNLMTEIVSQLRGDVANSVPRILDAVFECTLSMITLNFQDFPDHRVNFFKLLEAVNTYTFSAIFSISAAHQKLVIDSIVWAFKHTARDIGETGLNILHKLLENIANAGSAVSQPFYHAYLLSLIQDILYVLTDRLHKAHFKQHVLILHHIFALIESGAVVTPLWESQVAIQTGATSLFEAKVKASGNNPSIMNNSIFVREFIRGLVSISFPNLQPASSQAFIDGLFDLKCDFKMYKSHLRDFLIRTLEFGDESSASNDLYDEEKQNEAAKKAAFEAERKKAVPGLQGPYDALDDL